MRRGARRLLVGILLVSAGFAYGAAAAYRGWFPLSRPVSQAAAEAAKGDGQDANDAVGGGRPANVSGAPQLPGFGRMDGRWRLPRGSGEGHRLSEEEQRALTQLSALGYLQGSVEAGPRSGVTVFDRARTEPGGLNLFNSGHEPGAELMDMEGRILHRWTARYREIWPEPLSFEVPQRVEHFLRRVYLYPNGDLLGIFEGIGMVKLSRDSKLLWANQGRMHHDLEVAPDGTIFTLAREELTEHPRLELDGPIVEDFVVVMSPDGEILRRVSILEALIRSDYAPYLTTAGREGDILHTNTIELLDARDEALFPMFREGHVLISIRRLDAVAVVDLEEEVVTWLLTGKWDAQHQPTVLANGNLLIFDNWGHGGDSQVLEIDPATQVVEWAYRGTADERLYSRACGSAQRLASGNTLISETDNGRAIEVTREGEIVWEFLNPHRAGESNELVASLFEVIRLDPAYVTFLPRSG